MKLVQQSQPFRARYAYQMKEVIAQLENVMRANVQHLNNSIHEYSNTALTHAHELTRTIESLELDIRKL